MKPSRSGTGSGSANSPGSQTLTQTFTEEQAAAALGMTLRMLADRRRAGDIDCIKNGHHIAYTVEHLEAFHKEHEGGRGKRRRRREEILVLSLGRGAAKSLVSELSRIQQAPRPPTRRLQDRFSFPDTTTKRRTPRLRPVEEDE